MAGPRVGRTGVRVEEVHGQQEEERRFLSMKLSFGLAASILSCGLFSGCATSPSVTNRPVNEYLLFLQERPGADLHGEKETAAKMAFENYLTHFTRENVLAKTKEVYAPDAFLNDTLKTCRGSEEIEKYFLKTVANADSITVKIEDVARSGNDYYFRWIMDLRYKAIQRGKTVHTVGITHVRFNQAGQAILHQDYWDSTSGFFQHVPVIGGGIGFIKKRL